MVVAGQMVIKIIMLRFYFALFAVIDNDTALMNISGIQIWAKHEEHDASVVIRYLLRKPTQTL